MGRAVSKERPLILRLQSIKLLNFKLILVVKSNVKNSYSGPVCSSDFFCVLLWLILYISLYFLYNINIIGTG